MSTSLIEIKGYRMDCSEETIKNGYLDFDSYEQYFDDYFKEKYLQNSILFFMPISTSTFIKINLDSLLLFKMVEMADIHGWYTLKMAKEREFLKI